MSSEWLNGFVAQHGLGLGLIAVFIGGLLLNLTPCVYPMIPVTIAFFSGQAAFSRSRPAWALGRAALLACCYVLGLSLSYAVLGAIAASTGALLGAWLQQPVVLLAVASIMVGLSLSMFGLYDLRPPRVITQRLGQASAGMWGAVGMGMVVGLVAAPCIGPFVLGLLLLISQLGNPIAGFLLLFVLGLGMGLPYVILGIWASRIGHLPKAGAWLVWSKKLLGVVLWALALHFIRPLLPPQAVRWLWVGLLVGAGAYLGWGERTPSRGAAFRWIRWLIGGALVAVAAIVAWPQPQATASVGWIPYSEAALAQAQREHRPIVIDVYADWCLPCVEMDHVTFRHADVVQALSTVATLRLDVTREVPEEGEALLERSQVFGAPTVLLFDSTGKERKDLRLLGFVAPEEFLERLSRIQ